MKNSASYFRNSYRSAKMSFFFLTVLLVFSFVANAQQNFALDRDAVLPYDKLLNDKNVDFHTAIKPFLTNELVQVKDSALDYYHYKAKQKNYPDPNSKALRIDFRPGNLNLTGGYDIKNHTQVLDAYGSVGFGLYYSTKLAVVFHYLGGYSLFPGYIDSTAKSGHVVPGIGSAYNSGRGYTYQDYFGYISYTPNKIFNFQIGKDKHFFGDGYRSMFLSDNAANYPFLKIQVSVWKIKWVNLFTVMRDAIAPSGLQQDFKTKYASMQYLSWNVTKRINLGFFESIVWQGNDTNRVRGFDINYMNPVLFYRPTEYSLGSADNALLGGSFKVKLPLQLQLYGQALLDEFLLKEMIAGKGWWGNKYALQIGLKAFDLFGIKNLYLLTEFNYVRPYTYSHGSVQQNYGHYNQPLADPLGANFKEFVGILDYRFGRFIVELKGVAALTGLDTAGKDFGQNIFLSYSSRANEYGNYVGQGRKTIIGSAEFRIAYLIIPSMNLKAELGFNYHTERSSGLKTMDAAIVTFGFKTSLYNTYRDF
jgi:hypothetical protein